MGASCPVTYEVLGPRPENADASRFDRLYSDFVAGYARHFSGNEAEPTSSWPDRIGGRAPRGPLMRIVVAVDHADGAEQVVGGIAAEYYAAARCLFATYLYVDDRSAHRRHGHARDLLREARRAFADLRLDVEATFAEAEWPDALRLDGHDASRVDAARDRLAFFARLGARLINVDYVQPRLAEHLQPVSHLRLFEVPPAPDDPGLADDALASLAHAFLAAFYTAAGQEQDAKDTLTGLSSQLQQRRPLSIPLPCLRLDDVAVCLHFAEEVTVESVRRDLRAYLRKTPCPVLHSMETDVLSRAYRQDRLFRTVCLTKPTASADDAGIPVEILFPRGVQFRSENRTEERVWPSRVRRLRAYLSLSFFFDSAVVVWHLTLKPETWLDELDLVALLSATDDGADQESVRVSDTPGTHDAKKRIAEGLACSIPGRETPAGDLTGLLRGVAEVARERLAGQSHTPHKHFRSAPSAATVEVLGWPIDPRQTFSGIRNPRQREALCGIVSGILDFDEMDDAEVEDILAPSVPRSGALLRAHRETVTYVREDDRAARAVAGTTGISPYLSIPHGAVVANEWLLKRSTGMRLPDPRADAVGELSVAVERLEDALRTKWVPNAFFYDSERKLYEAALVEKGISARRAKAEDQLRELKTRLEVARELRRMRFESVVTALLGAISVLALDPVVTDTVRWVVGLPQLTAGWTMAAHALTVLAACVVGGLVYRFKRPLSRVEEHALVRPK